MKENRRGLNPLYIAISLIILSSGILLLSHFGYRIPAVERVAQVLTYPFRAATNAVMNSIESTFAVSEATGDPSDENQRLQSVITKLKSELADVNECKAENARLKVLLNYSRDLPYDTIGANVVGRDREAWRSSVIVDKGSADGVSDGMTVVGAGGVVGRVISTSLKTSSVMLITDPQSSIAGIIQNTRAPVIVEGTGNSANKLQFDCLIGGDQVNEGDTVITSGLGGIFPKGLVIGETNNISKGFYGVADTGTITPSVDFDRLESVLIIISNR